MQYTVFDTPVIRVLIRRAAMAFLKMTGWKAEGRIPDAPKFVLIAAPHTSNWDLPFALCIAFALRIKIYWMGKSAIFRRPFRRLFLWLGGIPVDRSRSHNVVEQLVRRFHEEETLALLIAPSGTRKRVAKWKTGFYYTAYGANAPIVLGFLDYGRKVGGVGPAVRPTGDIAADMNIIRAFYDGVTGKYPEKSIGFVGASGIPPESGASWRSCANPFCRGMVEALQNKAAMAGP